MTGFHRAGIVVAAGLLLTGCATGGFGGNISGGGQNLSPSERRLQDLEGRVAELSRRLDAVNLTAMDQENQQVRDDLRDLRGQVERLRYDFDQSQARAKQQYLDLDARLQRFENPSGVAGVPPAGGAQVDGSGTVVTPPPSASSVASAGNGSQNGPVSISNGSGASPEEEGAYLTAFDSLKNGHYDDAIRGFRALLKKWPQGRFADNALYWTGEAYYVKRDYKSALTAFQGVVSQFPQSPKVPDALLKSGLTQIDMNQDAAGKATLQKLVASYPQSNAARIAQQRLSPPSTN